MREDYRHIPAEVFRKAYKLARKHGCTIYAFKQFDEGDSATIYSKSEPSDGFTFCVQPSGIWDAFIV